MLERARRLRREATDAERALWSVLRRRGLQGYKFKRQVWIGAFIADFVCEERKLIVEVDGGQHAAQADYDARRTELLARRGYRVIRVWSNEVLANLEGVCEHVLAELRK